MKHSYWIVALVIIVVAACSSEGVGNPDTDSDAGAAPGPVTPDAALANTYWKLVELNGAAVEPGEGRELHMVLKGEDRVGGYAGCNQFTGSVTVTGDGLAFGPMASTRRMCAEVMAQENAYLHALESASRYGISGDDLVIENAAGEILMRFAAVHMP